jgi:glycosyltransferase involved in cell wall biosynthesis
MQVIVIFLAAAALAAASASCLAFNSAAALASASALAFPFDSALTCGLDHAESDYLVIMTSDLQDPPETLHDLLRESEKGFDQVVVKIRKRSQVPWPRRLLSQLFYRISHWSTNGLIPRNVSDYRIMSRKVYSQIKSLRESHRFMDLCAVLEHGLAITPVL